MNCPKCIGKLEEYTIESISVDRCFVCEGIWFDAGELEEVIKRDAKSDDYIDVGNESYDGAEVRKAQLNFDPKSGKCPKCNDGAILIASQYEKNQKVRVDMCPKGHGVWLDGGEVTQLQKNGLIALNNQIAYYKEMFAFLFTKQGFKEVFSKGILMLKNKGKL